MHDIWNMHPGLVLGSALAVVALGLGLLLLFVHFLPSYFAFKRNNPMRWIILILNTFLGWTLILWVVLLVWALATPPVVAGHPPGASA